MSPMKFAAKGRRYGYSTTMHAEAKENDIAARRKRLGEAILVTVLFLEKLTLPEKESITSG